jgi:short subunit dehydrogenase-like uncharacterized protein
MLGKMAAVYLARRYGNNGGVKWAIAGRRQQALDEVKQACVSAAAGGVQASDVKTIIADSSNEQSLKELCAQTKVVVSTAGPFAKIKHIVLTVSLYPGSVGK